VQELQVKSIVESVIYYPSLSPLGI